MAQMAYTCRKHVAKGQGMKNSNNNPITREEKNKELDSILNLLKKAGAGLNITEIEQGLAQELSRRTLQRRLLLLEQRGDISCTGEKRARRYFHKQPNEQQEITLSKEGEETKLAVRQPLVQRKPVAYKPNFLYDYQPNNTFYLPESTRKHLEKLGGNFSGTYPAGTYAKRILDRLLIDLSWNSSRLEGNTYSLLETQRLIEYGADVSDKHAFETQMILNHKDAIEFIVEQADQLTFSKDIVLNIHALLSNNLLANPKARGQLRQIPVGIGKTVYQPPEIPQLIEECFLHILTSANAIKDPFEQAFFFMVHLPYLQPFEDVNKRVSRIGANIPLIKHNLAPLSFTDVPHDDYISGLLAIYELNKISLMRDVFVWAYERSAAQYQVVQETLSQPNLIQMRFRKELFELVNLIVERNIRGKMIIEYISSWTKEHIPESSQSAFSQIVETEVAGLHSGNISIYRITPENFSKWRLQ